MRYLLLLTALCLASDAHAQTDTIVRNLGAPRYAGGARLVEELSIGAEDRGEEYQFTSISSILPARDGTVWVLNSVPFSTTRGSSFVRRYDRNGQFVSTVALAGQGPGEFRNPLMLWQLADGRVLLRDDAGGTDLIHVFSATGAPLTRWTVPRVTGAVRPPTWLVADSAGVIYAQVRMAEVNPRARLNTVVRIASDGTVIDVLPPDDLSAAAESARESALARGTSQPSALTIYSPLGYAVTALTSRYAIDLRIPSRSGRNAGPGGITSLPTWSPTDPVVSLRRNPPLIEYPAAERRARDEYARWQQSRGRGNANTLPTPRLKSPVSGLEVGADGTIWVSVPSTSEQYTPAPSPVPALAGAPRIPWRQPTVFDVIEPGGVYIGQARLPYDVRIFYRDRSTMWGVRRNAEGVERVVRFRLDWQ